MSMRADDFACACNVSQEAAAHLFQRNSKGSGIGHIRYLWRCRYRAELKPELVAILYDVSTNPSDNFPEPTAARRNSQTSYLWSPLYPYLPFLTSTAERRLPYQKG